MNESTANRIKVNIYAFLTILLWGSGFPFTRVIGDEISPYSLSFIRCALAAVILLVIGLNKRLQNIPLSEADEFKNSILSYFRENHYSICDKIETLKELSEEDKNFIIETADNYISGEWKK